MCFMDFGKLVSTEAIDKVIFPLIQSFDIFYSLRYSIYT